jgi:signal transduction histidine kinase
LSAVEQIALLEIRDTGIGIAEENLAHVFGRFYRVQNHETETRAGTGLGLAIVKRLVEKHAGTIHLTSAPGVGTVVTIIFPIYDSGSSTSAIALRT